LRCGKLPVDKGFSCNCSVSQLEAEPPSPGVESRDHSLQLHDLNSNETRRIDFDIKSFVPLSESISQVISMRSVILLLGYAQSDMTEDHVTGALQRPWIEAKMKRSKALERFKGQRISEHGEKTRVIISYSQCN
jgi:hypothetical protein